MAVRDEDRGAGSRQVARAARQFGRFATWVDDDCLVGPSGPRARRNSSSAAVPARSDRRRCSRGRVYRRVMSRARIRRAALEAHRDRHARRLTLTGGAPLAQRREPRRPDRARGPDRSWSDHQVTEAALLVLVSGRARVESGAAVVTPVRATSSASTDGASLGLHRLMAPVSRSTLLAVARRGPLPWRGARPPPLLRSRRAAAAREPPSDGTRTGRCRTPKERRAPL